MANGNGKNIETKAAFLKQIEQDGYNYGKRKTARGDLLTHVFDGTIAGHIKYVEPLRGAAAEAQKTDVKDTFASFKKGDEAAGGSVGSGKTELNWFNTIAWFAANGVNAAAVVEKAHKKREALKASEETVVDVGRMLLALAGTAKGKRATKNSPGSPALKRALNADEIEAAVRGGGKGGGNLESLLSRKETGVIALAANEMTDDVAETPKGKALAALVKAAQAVLPFLKAEAELEKAGTDDVDQTMETWVRLGKMKRLANGTYRPV